MLFIVMSLDMFIRRLCTCHRGEMKGDEWRRNEKKGEERRREEMKGDERRRERRLNERR